MAADDPLLPFGDCQHSLYFQPNNELSSFQFKIVTLIFSRGGTNE